MAPMGGTGAITDLEAARDLHQRGDLAGAERLYRSLLDQQPGNADALHLLGYIALQTGRWQQAAEWIGRSLQVDPTQQSARLNLGVALRSLARFDAALACVEGVLAAAPNHVEALQNRGDLLIDMGRPAEALASLERALQLRPDFPEALNNRGRAQNALGQMLPALQSFDEALRLVPTFARAHTNRGTVLRHLNRLEDALASFDHALRFDPHSLPALYNRGNTLLELERDAEALQCYEQLLDRDARDAETWSNCGIALLRLGRLEESLAALNRALELQPNFPQALNNLGNTLRKLGRPEEALSRYDEALRLLPQYADSLSNRGVVLSELHRHPEALASHERAVALQGDNAEYYYNRGNTHMALRQMQAALEDFERSLVLRADVPDALFNRGVASIKLKRYEDAAAALDRLLQVEPSYPWAHGVRFLCRAQICDWTDAAAGRERLVTSVGRGEPADEPFSFLAVSGSAAAQLECARTYMAERFPAAAGTVGMAPRQRGERIRVAYVSGDFRDHPAPRLLAGVFETHDRRRFEIVGVALRAPDASVLGRRVSAAFDRLVDASAMSDSALVASMREMRVDIAVDLMGCTEGQRSRIFAQRAAPVQVNFIGYPGTVGVDYLDYLIADRFVVPPERRADYAEHIVYLPDCFQPNDDRRFMPERGATREDEALPERGLVWCCFNNPSRITPDIFDVWMRLLQQVPDSILWLYVEGPVAERNLRGEAARRGVDPRRLVFAVRVPYEQHLARLGLADVFLDTAPFNGGTTVSDALWIGLPVVTCAGDAFAARMAGSLLRTLGLPELVTTNLEEYASRALELGACADRRALLRARLGKMRLESPLFDTRRYCRHLESAYQTMWDRCVRGECPAMLEVGA